MPTDTLQFVGTCELLRTAGEGKRPRLRIVASVGQVGRAPGWGLSVMDHAGGILPAAVPVLVDHVHEIDGTIGGGRPRMERGELVIDSELADNEPAAKVLTLLKAGTPLQASGGYDILEVERVPPGKSAVVNGRTIKADTETITVVRRWKLREVSILPLAADADTSVELLAARSLSKGNQTVEPTNTTIPAPVQTTEPTAPERILRAWNETQLSTSTRERLQATLTAALAGKITPDVFELELTRGRCDDLELHALRTNRAPAIGPDMARRGDVRQGDILRAAMLSHLGAEHVAVKAYGDQAMQRARDLRATSMVEILGHAFRAEGIEAPHGRETMIRAAFSTASISNIVSDSANKLLLDQWARLPLSSLLLARRVSAKDFKGTSAVRLVGHAMMEEVGSAGEIKHGHLTDSTATVKLATYAKMFALTRQQIINDDLGAFAELPNIIATGAGRKMESVFWTLVLANTGSYFHTDNANLITDVLAITGLGKAVETMRKLVDTDGEPILVEPKYLVVPPELEAAADALFASTNVTVAGTAGTVTTTPDLNTLAGKYQPVCVPYISNDNYTGNSETQWYLFADPKTGGPAAFAVALLNGNESPTIEQSATDFNTLGVQWRGYLDFAFGQLDSEGAVKSTGAGA